MKNVLITGGAGFIGSSLTLKLVKVGYNVTVLDNLSQQIHGTDPENTSYLYKRIVGVAKFIKGSVLSKEDWMKALQGQDAVIHLAAETGTGQSMYEINRYVDVNIRGTALMLDVLANEKTLRIKKIVLSSSRSIYGEGKYLTPDNVAVYPNHRRAEDMDKGLFEVKVDGIDGELQLVATDEDSLIHPSSVYGITKQVQEQLVMTVCPTINIAPVIFRYQNVYGPGQSLVNPYTGILSIFSTLIRSGKEINIFEDGKESRDFVYIDDVVDATVAGLESARANGEIFNVGSGVPVDVLTVAQELISNYGQNCNLVISGNYRLGDIRHNYASLSKITRKLSFQPKYDFKTGIKMFTDWVSSQASVENGFEDSLSIMKDKGFFK